MRTVCEEAAAWYRCTCSKTRISCAVIQRTNEFFSYKNYVLVKVASIRSAPRHRDRRIKAWISVSLWKSTFHNNIDIETGKRWCTESLASSPANEGVGRLTFAQVCAKYNNWVESNLQYSVTDKKLPNVYKSCPKMTSLEKLKVPLQKLPKNVGDLGKLIVAKGFEKLPKVQ